MSTSKLGWIALSAVVAAVSLFSLTSSAFAQRDAGAKARGDMGGFWDSRPMTRSYAPPSVQSRRSFSYEPQGAARRSYSYEPAPAAPRGCPGAATAQGEVEARRFSYEPTPQVNVQPRYERRDPRLRNPIERRLRPGIGFWN